MASQDRLHRSPHNRGAILAMTGEVSEDLEALVPLTLRSPDGDERTVMCIVDTGFDGEVALPFEDLERLDALFSSHRCRSARRR